jgi:hypothetical protein
MLPHACLNRLPLQLALLLLPLLLLLLILLLPPGILHAAGSHILRLSVASL